MNVETILRTKGRDVATISPLATIKEALQLLAERDVGALVVSEDGRTVLGVLSERDIVRKLRTATGPRDQTVTAIMTVAADVQVCRPEDSFHTLMSIMTDHRVRHVPVIDENGLVDILSIGDAVKYRMDQLEFERDQLNQYVTGSRG